MENSLTYEVEILAAEGASVHRVAHNPQSKEYQEAIVKANLFIDGEGRLGEDRKPGVVSSRTRQGRKKLLDIDGTIPAEQIPQFSSSGELLWAIAGDVLKSQPAPEDDIFGVEFKVKIFPPRYVSSYPKTILFRS